MMIVIGTRCPHFLYADLQWLHAQLLYVNFDIIIWVWVNCHVLLFLDHVSIVEGEQSFFFIRVISGVGVII